MMKRSLIMAIVVLIGLTTVALSASADFTGLNVTQDDREVVEFGWVQIICLVIGVGIIISGIILGFVMKRMEDNVEDEESVEDVEDSEEEKEEPQLGLMDDEALN